MLRNFHRRLEIKGGETIWLVNSTRSFLKNFLSNVPKPTKVLYEYKNEPVDIIIYWLEKNDTPEAIIKEYKDLTKSSIWLVTSKASMGIPESHILDMTQNKVADFTPGEMGVRFVKR